jgi:hypothetical protein
MKTFIIRELVLARVYRTIYVEAEDESDAVSRYYNDPDECTVDEEVEYIFESAEIGDVEEGPEA